MPVAVNCCVSPLAIDGLAGVTAIDTSVTAGVTVNVAGGLVTPPYAAVMLVEPTVKLVASPVLLIVATVGVAELHVAELVRFAVLESL